MYQLHWIFIETLLIASGILLLYIIRRRGIRPKNYPPGPFPLPIIGNLHNLGLRPYRTFEKLRVKYGDVFAIDFGSYRTVVLNGNKMLKKYLSMPQTAGRPHLLPLVERSSDGIPRGIVATEGEVFAEQRRFVLKNLRDFGFGKKSMEGMILDEVAELLEVFDESKRKPIRTQHIMRRVTLNSLYTICVGIRADKNDHEFETILKNVTAVAQAPMPLLWFFPRLGKMFPNITGYKQLLSFSTSILDVLRRKYVEHKMTFEEQNGNKRDLIDCYVEEIQNTTDPNSSFYKDVGEDNMLFSILDMLTAGAETTGTTLVWTMLILAVKPEVQEKLQEEIDLIIGPQKPSLIFRDKMPFFQSLILEVLRYVTLAPFGVFHSTLETLEIEGYQIPKGTIITTNLFGAHRDKEEWGENAEEFIADRFLTEDSKSIDFNKSKAVLAFSTGKRICPGEALARETIFLFVTSIFQKYSVTVVQNKRKPTLDFKMGTVMTPLPHELIFNRRRIKSE